MGNNCHALVVNLIAVVDLVIGVITLLACLPAILAILSGNQTDSVNSGKTIEYVRKIGVFSIAFFAFVEALTGLFYIVTAKWGKRCGCLNFKSFLFLFLEVLEFAVPFIVIKNYSDLVDELIATEIYYCNVLYLLKLNPLTIGLFVYQTIALLVVWTSDGQDLPKKSTSRKCKNSFPLLPLVHSSQLSANPEFRIDQPNAPLMRSTLLKSSGYDWAQTPNKVGNSSSSSSIYHTLRANCLKSGTLYKDPEFPATFASLRTPDGNTIQWKRPHEIISQPKFFSGEGYSNGVSRFDVKQGDLGNCWFLAAVANLTLQPDLFHRVVPADNAEDLKDKSRYAGICHFRFWDNGSWKEVIIDDRLPTRNGKLLFMTSADDDEFWSPLLEKAYAKFCGSYQDLDGGKIGTAMKHFTGGSIEVFRLKGNSMNSTDLFRIMDTALSTGNLLGASISDVPRRKSLIGTHAYSITAVKRVTLKTRGPVMLLRIRNPWGNGTEWEGDWKDGHPLWNQVDKATRKQLEVIFEKDGEFWFPFKEFNQYFDFVEICYVNSNPSPDIF